MKLLQHLQNNLQNLSAEEGLAFVAEMFPGKARFSSSLGQEDQVLTEMIARNHTGISVFTIDTGRLFNETYELIERTESLYGIKVDIYFPDTKAVEQMVNTKGINLFYDSVENRNTCCGIRKVEPLNRALQGADMWITGLRSAQTTHRTDLPIIEWLPEKNLYKYNPLLNWSYEDVMEYLHKNSVPYNTLHDKGFISIGCAPCTRAISPGEDPRAGRWWWEASHKECGLHTVKLKTNE